MLNCAQNDVSMRCTLLIPHLFWPHDASGEAYRDLILPDLQALLARSRRRSFPSIGTAAWLCRAFEVERQRDWPVAPLTLSIDGGEPGEAYWLRADPVHLRPHGSQLLLADSSVFAISQLEADPLIVALNRHFVAEGLQFCAPHPDRWYLRLEADPEIATHALDEVAERNIDRFLPTGNDALRWHRICNEIQMLFHAHPVNETREQKGEPMINSVWLWGGGRKPAVPGRQFSALWSDDALALALAASAHIHAAPAPADGEHWLHLLRETSHPDGHHLLVLAQLARATRRGDVCAWRNDLVVLDRQWFAPLLAALKQRLIAQLALVAPCADGCLGFELAPRDLLKFWRTVQPLSAHAPDSLL